MSRLHFLFLTAALSTSLLGQNPPTQDSSLVEILPDIWRVEWPSVVGRTYFVAWSDNMVDWHYFDYIEQGDGNLMTHPVSPTGERFFAQVRYSDEATNDPLIADFDDDGITNWGELSTHQTDPLSWDTDGDGLEDLWEISNGLDPLDDGSTVFNNGAAGDPDGDGVTNLEEYLYGGNPSTSGADTDSDGVNDGFDAALNNATIKWMRLPYHRYRVEVLGDSVGVSDPIAINDRGDVLFKRHVWYSGDPSPTTLATPGGTATYWWLDASGTGYTVRTATLATDVSQSDDKDWQPLAINNAREIIGNGVYTSLDLADAGNTWRGIYWSDATSPVVTNPAQPYDESPSLFYGLTHGGHVIGVDTQIISRTGLPPVRKDLVRWAPGRQAGRIAPFSVFGTNPPFDPPTNVYPGSTVSVGSDHYGNLLLSSDEAYDTFNGSVENPGGQDIDVARVDDDHLVFIDQTGGRVNGTFISALQGIAINRAGQVLGPVGNSLWMNGQSQTLQTWVQPDPNLREWSSIQGYALSDSGLVAASGTDFDGNEKLIILHPVYPGQDLEVSAHDATGPRYRKVALNGVPLPDEMPQATAEEDTHKEQTYIDAFSRELVHHTSDIYVPVSASDLVLQVTRSYREEIWNDRHGLHPHERYDLPFGAGWSSNLCASITIVHRTSSGSAEPVTLTVTDEEGRGQRFGTYDGDYYFPMPSGRVEKKRYMNTLEKSGNTFTYSKKFGTTLTYQLTSLSHSIAADRIDPEAGETLDYTYARLTTVADRYGNTLTYNYEAGNNSLMPNSISAGQGRVQVVTLTLQSDPGDANIKRVTAVTDPRSNTTTYGYSDPGAPGDPHLLKTLTDVAPPGFTTSSPATAYRYGEAQEQDFHPRARPSINARPVLYEHFRLETLTDAKNNTTAFEYIFDHTKWGYHTGAGIDNHYIQTGLPSLVTRVDLPNNTHTTFAFSGESGYPSPSSDAPTKLVIQDAYGRKVDAYKKTWVKDAKGNERYYEFTSHDTVNLASLPGNRKPGDGGNSNQLIVSYLKMRVESVGVGEETFQFDPSAGYALSKVTDLSGNTTAYEYDSVWTPDSPAFRYILNDKFGYFDDPTAEMDPLGRVTQYEYSDNFRVLSKIVHVDGSVTEYEIDSLGRRTSESIKQMDPASSTLTEVQKTEFAYSSTFPAFLYQKLVKDLNLSGEPSWVTTRRERFYPSYTQNHYRRGRLYRERFYYQYASATYHDFFNYYDANGNRTAIKDAKAKNTYFTYDSRNRLTKVKYPGGAEKNLSYDANGNKVGEQDERGHWTLFEYDSLNRLIADGRDMNGNGILDARGTDIRTDYEYYADGTLEKTTDPRNHVTTHFYDAARRLTSTVAPYDGVTFATTSYAYAQNYSGDPAGTRRNPGASIFDTSGWNPTRIVDPRGYETLFAHDEIYRVVHQKAQYELGPSAAYAETTTSYDDTRRLVTTVDDLGEVTEATSDALGRLVSQTVAKGTADEATTSHHYTSTGLLWKTVDAEGRETELEYDTMGRQTKLIQPDFTAGTATAQRKRGPGSPVTETRYDANSNVVSITDPEDNETLFVYDARNRRTAEVSPSITDALGAPSYRTATLTEYDDAGNVVKVIDRRGLNVSVTGNPAVATVTPAGNSTSYTTETNYDEANRPEKVIEPAVEIDGLAGTHQSETEMEYDDAGNVTKVTDAEGNITLNTYDPVNRLESTTTNPTSNQPDPVGTADDATNIVVTYEYDKAGNQTKVTDGENQVTSFTYDGFNRRTETNFDPNDSRKERTKFVYNAINLTDRQTLNSSGGVYQSTGYAYDHQHRLQTVTYTGSTVDNQHYAYDAVGNIQSVKVGVTSGSPDPLRSVYYTHDTLNRVKTETSANVTHTVTTYDKAGNREVVTYGGTGGKVLTCTYDELNRLATCTEGGRVTKFGYDLAGNLEKRLYPNAVTETRDHDARNRLTSLDVAKTQTLVDYDQRFDHVGNVQWIQEQHTGSTLADRTLTLNYDHVYRLAEEIIARSGGGSQTTTFGFDDANNRTSKVVTGSGPSGFEVGTWTYTYGNTSNGRNSNQLYQVSKSGGSTTTLDYDLKGNLASQQEGTKTLTYTYDHENRLIKATLPNNYTVPDGTTLAGQRDYEFEYDYRTRRVYRKERSTTSGSQTFFETTSSYNGGTSVQEYDGASASGSPDAHYVRGSDFGGGVGGILYSHRGSALSYFHYNGRGDVTTKSDSSGNSTTWQSAYGAFGEHLTGDTAGGSNSDPQRANTKEESPDLRMINEGYRIRLIDFAVFGQRDPAGFVDGPNVYTFVRQNPWSAFDPLGLKYSDQFTDDGYLKTNELKGRRLDKANQFNESWKKIRETKAGKALHGYIGKHKREVSVDLTFSARNASVRNHREGAMLEIGERPMSFDVTAEEMIHVGQNFVRQDFIAKNPQPKINPKNVKADFLKYQKWEAELTKAEGNFIPELPTYVAGDERYDSEVRNGTDGSREIQAMRGVNILRYEFYKLKKPDQIGSFVNSPAIGLPAEFGRKRLKNFHSSNHGAIFWGSEFGGYSIPELQQ